MKLIHLIIMDNELLAFSRHALATARRCVPLQLTNFSSPTCDPVSLFAGLSLRERLRLTYRGLEDLLRLSGRLRRPSSD